MKHPFTIPAAACALILATGCGGDDGGGKTDGAETPEDDYAIPAECRGFPLEGIRYSPGGTALPDTCKPFHPTLNNPYAVRCVDALPSYKTPYRGDEYCILPPAPENGMQVGVHPQAEGYWEEIWDGDLGGYSDAALTAPFELEPGGEIEQTYDTNTPNDDEHYYYRVDSRMRTGSHHLASAFSASALEEGWVEGPPAPGGFRPGDGGPLGPSNPADEGKLIAKGTFFNVQRADTDRPLGSIDIPEEDRGIGLPLAPHQGIHFDLHHFNTTDGSILREAWVNVWWTTEVTERGREFAGVTGVDVAPGETKDLSGTLTATGTTRILSLFGHRHAWTSNFEAWVERADGAVETVYRSVDWLDVPTFSYDSLTTNPIADAEGKADGAISGIFTLEEGDKMHFNCHVEATAERAQAVGAPMLTEPLAFGNHVFTSEMCILYGFHTGEPMTGAFNLN